MDMTTRDVVSTEQQLPYMSKKVVINGQTVTLYSVNGQTWLSSPEELPDVMARLENTRVLLNDPKGEGAALPPKPTAARYRLRGPKARPILQQDGVVIEGPTSEEISATEVEIRVGVEALEVISRPEKGRSREVTRVIAPPTAQTISKLTATVDGPASSSSTKLKAKKPEERTQKEHPAAAAESSKAPASKLQARAKVSKPAAAPKAVKAKPAKTKVVAKSAPSKTTPVKNAAKKGGKTSKVAASKKGSVAKKK